MQKIKSIFVNVEEIYLYNYYCLNDELLQDVIDFLSEDENRKQIKQIKLLYYDYDGDIKEHKDDYGMALYQPISALNAGKLKCLHDLGWECKETEQRMKDLDDNESQYGVKIRILPKQPPKHSGKR